MEPLAAPGETDLTVHADFPSVAAAARKAGARTAPILAQGAFLARLGIHQRAEALARARPGRAAEIARQLDRLIAPDQMGELFKALAVYADTGMVPPGFKES